MLVFGIVALLLVLTNTAEAQFLRNLLQDGTPSSDWNLRDDRPTEESEEELSFEEIIKTKGKSDNIGIYHGIINLL